MKKIGVYAGSFNPFHVGHADILHQALEVFDEVIVAIGNNPLKDNDKEPFPFNNPILKIAKVAVFDGLLSDYLKRLSDNNENIEVFLVRGLRNGEDLQYEQRSLKSHRRCLNWQLCLCGGILLWIICRICQKGRYNSKTTTGHK